MQSNDDERQRRFQETLDRLSKLEGGPESGGIGEHGETESGQPAPHEPATPGEPESHRRIRQVLHRYTMRVNAKLEELRQIRGKQHERFKQECWEPLPSASVPVSISKTSNEAFANLLQAILRGILIPSAIENFSLNKSFDVGFLLTFTGGPPGRVVVHCAHPNILSHITRRFDDPLHAEQQCLDLEASLETQGVRRFALVAIGRVLTTMGSGIIETGACLPIHLFFDRSDQCIVAYNLHQLAGPENFLPLGCASTSSLMNFVAALDTLQRHDMAHYGQIKLIYDEIASAPENLTPDAAACLDIALNGWRADRIEVLRENAEVWRHRDIDH